MSVAYDASNGGGFSNVSSASFSVTVAGANRLMHFGVTFFRNNNSEVSDATYNSVSSTAVTGGSTNNGSNYTRTRYLVAPATGANTAQVTFSGNAPFDGGFTAVSMTGVDQVAPLGTAAAATGTSTTPSAGVSGETADDMVVDQLTIVHSGTLSVGANQTQRVNSVSPSGFLKYAASTQDAADGGTMSWSNTNSVAWSMVANLVKAAADGQPFVKRFGGVPFAHRLGGNVW